MVSALDYLHDKSIAHRDLKLENLMLVDAKNPRDVKLVDFGFACYTRGRDLRHLVGTPDYVCFTTHTRPRPDRPRPDDSHTLIQWFPRWPRKW